MIRFRSYILGRNTREGTCLSHCIIHIVCIMSINIVAGDTSLVHLAQVVSAGFLYHKVTIFLFVINKYLAGNYFETMQMSCSHNFFPTNFCIH